MSRPKSKRLEDFCGDISNLMPPAAKPDEKTSTSTLLSDGADNQHVQVKQTVNRHHLHRVTSEIALEKELPWHFEPAVSYHCISHGDVDSLTYLRVIVKQQKIRYALLSTWVCASEDIAEIRNWVARGYIGRIDFYIGEIFKASYYKQYGELISLCREFGGRVCIARNHSKIIAAFGERFDAVIESSANVNHNPRIEQTVITVDSELALWYKEFFDGLKSFERDFDDVQPWQPPPAAEPARKKKF